MLSIDLNCDMGEGFPNDALLMPWISSANIACGYHAGDKDTMRRTVELALQHNVSIGAHPGYADRENFGRTEMTLPPEEVHALVTEQIFALQKIAKEFGARIAHVKPHGALYNMAARDNALAAVIAKAVRDVDMDYVFFGLSGTHSISEAAKLGLQTASEVFADRTYQDDGSLTPRKQPGAMIEDETASIAQVLQMIQHGTVTSLHNKPVSIIAQTLCLHGDGDHAVVFAKKIHQTLQQNHIGIKSC